MAKKVLITGADGFIGSHLAEEMVKSGISVKALVQYNSFGSHGWLDNVRKDIYNAMEVVLGDIRDPHFISKIMQDCEGVMHLAALIAIPYSYHSPEAYVQTNVIGTLNILQAARNLGLNKVVHTSTSEVYGTAQFVPITEEHPLNAQSPYAATKIAADQMALSFYRSFETPVAVVRPFNTYGPRQSARAIIPTIITQIVSGKRKIELGALSPTRDFNYVQDTVRGMKAVYDSGVSIGEVINIGSGFEISIKDTVELIAEIIGVSNEIDSQAERLRPKLSEVERLCAANEKACRLLNWSPNYVGREGLKRGIQHTVEWFKEPSNLAYYRVGEYVI